MKAIRILTLITGLFSGGHALAADSAQVVPSISLTGERAVAQLKESGQYDSIAAAYEAARHAVRADGMEPDGELHAQNPGHGLSASFDRHGLHLSVQRHGSEGGRLTTRWRLNSVGRDGAVEKVPAGGTLRHDGQRAEIVRDGLGLTEWFINRSSGLEHGFTLKRRPAGEGALRLDIAIDGDLSPVPGADGQRIELRDAAGAKVLDYDKLRVWDAAGQELPARMDQSEEGGLRFQVEDAGARYPLTVDPTFTQQAYLKASNTGANDLFGGSVAIDGNTVVVGAPGEASSTTGINSTPNESALSAGAAYVFVRSGSTWTEQAYLKASGTGADDAFGISVAVSGDTLVVGADKEDSGTTGSNSTPDESALNAGAAYVFVRSSGTWTQQAYLKAANAGAGDQFGYSVAVDGTTVVVGAISEDSSTTGSNSTPDEIATNAGAAYVFVSSSGTWTQQAYLKPAAVGTTQAGDQFGISVAVSGDTVVVGANREDSSTTGISSTPNESALNAGAAYVFLRSSGTWTQEAYLKPAAVFTTQAGDQFGNSVAVSGDTVAVGAPFEAGPNEGVRDAGAAYVFARSAGSWTQQAYLRAASGGDYDSFGWSVAVSGETLAAGAFKKSFDVSEAGAAHVFVRSASTWTERTPFLRASPYGQGDQFGGSVAVSGDTVVFGARFEDSDTTGSNSTPNESASNAGAAYVFTLIPDPTLTSVSPSTGSTAGGTAVTLTGTNFTGATNVRFGGTAATNRVVVNDTTITCTTPARPAGTASVLVTTPGGTNAANTLFTYFVPPPAPTLTSVSPATGSTAGGTAVTLTGTNFTGATAVTIGGAAATSVSVTNATTLTATTPAGSAGSASVLVTTPGGTNAANTLFTYVTPTPEITVSGNSAGIAAGDTAPDPADHTDFGSTAVIGGTVTRTFTVTNSGNAALNLTGTPKVVVGGANAADFTVTLDPVTPVAASGGTTTFEVTFDPGTGGLRTATLSIVNNDSNENPYDFAIAGTGLNLAPTDIALSNASLAENHAANATVGTLSASDVDAGDTHTFTLVTGVGDTDNASFSISGSALRLTPAADFETKNSYSLRVRAADIGGLAFEEDFTVSVTNVNEMPSFTKGANQTTSSTSAQTVSGWATALNDGDSTVTQVLAFNVSNNNPGLFSAPPAVSSGGTLTYTANGTIGTATLSVSLTDDTGIGGPGTALTSAVQTFTITVEPLLINGGGSDHFSGRTDLGGVVNAQITTTNLGATGESNEPTHADNDAEVSIWWKWTAPSNGSVEISTHGSSIDTVLAVYTGTSLSTLVPVASNDDADGQSTSRVTFNATAGTTYNIAVDGFDGMAGAIVLALRMVSGPPPNDHFAARTTLAGADPAASGVNSLATAESGEPAHAGAAAAATVWWSWTPPAHAVATVTAPGTGFSTRVAVYTGSALNALTLVAAGNGQAVFAATAGTAYHIAVDSADGATGLIQLNIASGPANPANDSFAGAAVLTEVAPGNSIGATAESGEPAHAGSPAANSVWWRWTAANTDRISLSTAGSGFVNRFAVYTGSAVNALTEIVASTTGSLQLSPVAGTDYYIAVDGVSGAAGAVVLSVGSAPPAAPSNDFFAARSSLGSAATASVSSSNVGAGSEPGEPDHAGAAAGASLWWTWTPPGPGSVIISTDGSAIDTRLAVYTGSALAGLTLVAANDDADASTTGSRVAFPIVPGTAYQIAVDGFAGFRGNVSLSITHVPPGTPPANDDFANAAVLTTGTPAAGTTINATAQTGEPTHATLPASRSVWWQWTAPANGTARLNTAGSTVDTVLAVYTGSAVNALTLVTENDDRDSQTRQSAAEFSAASGTQYFIAVDARSGALNAQGAVSLALTFAEDRFPNDHFAERFALAALDLIEVQSDFTLATAEAGEPAHGGSPAVHSGWWTWTAPRRGYYTLAAVSAAPVRTALYTGSALNALTNVATGSDTTPASFLADPAVPLQIAVDGTGVITLTLARVAPPANDNIAAAAVLSGTATGDLTQATAEEFETSHASVPANQSVWFTFTGGAAPEVIALSTQGSTADTVLAVYSGPANATLDALTLLKASNDTAAGSTWSEVSFRGEPGAVYYAVVDAADGRGGAFSLALTRQTINPGSNNTFSSAYLLTGPTVSTTGSNAYGSTEAGEPAHDGSAATSSTWWNWTAPVAGRYSVTTAGSSFATRIAIYTGTTLSGLTSVASGRQRADFTAQSGVSYAIAIDGVAGAEGSIALQISPLDVPANNQLANAANFTGSATGLNVLATAEAEEVPHAGSSAAHSLWWQWTPAQSGMATLATTGSGFDTVLSVYHGTRFSGITSLLVENDDSAGTASTVTFIAKAGVTYLIALDGKNGASGFFQLDLSLETDGPVNDDFADAAELTGSVATAIGDNLGATYEPGEDLHAGYLPDSSVWWKWTAGNTGNVTVDTAGSLNDTRMAVYTGGSVSQLTEVAANDDADILTVTSRITFAANAGTVYYFVVDTLAATSGRISINLAEAITPPMLFLQWAGEQGFGPGQNGPANDPDADGLPNMAEFTFGTNPIVAVDEVCFSIFLNAEHRMVCTSTVNPEASGVAVTLEWSSRADGGFENAGAPVAAAAGSSHCNLTWTDTQMVTPGQWRYARLRLQGYGQEVYSEVLGAAAMALPAATGASRATTFASLPLVQPRRAKARIVAVGQGSLTLGRTLPQFSTAPYIVLPDGTTSDITEVAGNLIQLSDDLSGMAATGMMVEIREHRTLGSLFGNANETGLTAGTGAASADTVLTVAGDRALSTHYYNSQTASWRNGDSPAEVSPIPPESGFIVQRLAGEARTLYVTGAVRGQLRVPVEAGYNLLGTSTPFAVRLDDLGLFNGNPATGLAAGRNAGAADNIIVMNPNGTSSLYFRYSGNGEAGWRDAAFTDASAVMIPPGTAFSVHRKAPRTAFGWSLPTP